MPGSASANVRAPFCLSNTAAQDRARIAGPQSFAIRQSKRVSPTIRARRESNFCPGKANKRLTLYLDCDV
jgi:hypothetical protein